MARITYYGHANRETGAERPHKSERFKVKMDVVITSGHGVGTASSFKTQRIPGALVWLLQEGMEVPVFTDEAGNAIALDEEGLAPLLTEEKESLDAAHKEQTSLTYDVPKMKELGDAKDIASEAGRAVKGLFKRKR